MAYPIDEASAFAALCEWIKNHPRSRWFLGGEGLIPELIYIAGPYRAETNLLKQENIAAAMDLGAELYRRGYAPFIPHSMTADFDELYPDIPDEVYLRTDRLWLSLCPSVFMLAEWEQSAGAQVEHTDAIQLRKQIYYNLADVPDLGDIDVPKS